MVLAFDDDLVSTLLSSPMHAFTDHTIVDGRALRARLASVREHGYALAVDEYAEGLSSAAAPVRNSAGRVVAALHVYGLPSAIPGERDPDELGRLVCDVATRLRVD